MLFLQRECEIVMLLQKQGDDTANQEQTDVEKQEHT